MSVRNLLTICLLPPTRISCFYLSPRRYSLRQQTHALRLATRVSHQILEITTPAAFLQHVVLWATCSRARTLAPSVLTTSPWCGLHHSYTTVAFCLRVIGALCLTRLCFVTVRVRLREVPRGLLRQVQLPLHQGRYFLPRGLHRILRTVVSKGATIPSIATAATPITTSIAHAVGLHEHRLCPVRRRRFQRADLLPEGLCVHSRR